MPMQQTVVHVPVVLLTTLAFVNAKMPVGINLEGKTYYSPGILFKNRFLQSMPFISQNTSNWSDQRPLTKDVNGFVTKLLPQQKAGTLMLRSLVDDGTYGMKSHFQTGVHHFFYEGNCSGCVFAFDAHLIDKSHEGHWIVNVTGGSGGVYFYIENIPDSHEYPRNLRLVHEKDVQNYERQLFDDQYLSLLRTAEFSVIRFMDFLRTNESPNKDWEGRTHITNATQAGNTGVSYEYIVRLVNELKVSPWINVPHEATDDYVKQLATFFKENTGSDVPKIYVEYSNECWNSLFPCLGYTQEMGKHLSNNTYQAGLRWYAQRVCQISEIFKTVFGESDTNRLFFVMGSQAVNSWVSEQVLGWNYNGHNTSTCVDAVAVAGYFGLNRSLTSEQIMSMSIADLFNNMETQGRAEWRQQMERQMNVSKQHGVGMVGYEGGCGLAPPFPHPLYENITVKYDSMCRDPRMTQAVYRNLDDWNEITGGQLMNEFSWIGWGHRYGDWGQLEYQDSVGTSGAYKYDGVVKFIRSQV